MKEIEKVIADRESRMYQYYKSVFIDGFEGGYNEEYDDGIKSLLSNALSSLEKKVEGMEKEVLPITYEPNPLNVKLAYHEQTLQTGYNQALSDVLSLIKTLREGEWTRLTIS